MEFVPIFRKDNDVIVNSEISPNDSITDTPSLIVPLMLNKTIMTKKTNHKPIDDYIKSTCVASLTSTRKGSAIQTISTLKDYYKSSVGQLLFDIGLNRARETHLHTEERKVARRIKRGREDFDPLVDIKLHEELLRQFVETKKINQVYKSADLYKCPRCEFKTEFAVVMKGHLENPHIDKKGYLCNWCDYKINDSADIVYHCLAKHKQRCRIEKPLPLHLCPYCPFEGPQYYDESEFPAVTSKFITQEDIKAYDSTLKTLRLAAYNPHQLKISGLHQSSNLPILLVQRQNGSLPSSIVINRGNQQGNNVTKDQSANVDGIANPSAHSNQLMQLLSGQHPNSSQLGVRTLQYPRAQSPFVNGNSVLRTTSDFVMAPNHQPRPCSGSATPAVDTTDLMQDKEDVQIPDQPTKSKSSNQKDSTFVICEICDEYIKDLAQLKSHMQWIHKVKIHQKMLVSRPPLNCQKCQWRFFTDQGLERHLLGAHGLVTSNMQELVEKGSDSGRCTVCGRAHASKLVAHMKEVHKSILKPAHLTYKCTVCSATFNLYRLFENHVYSVHSDSVRRLQSEK